MLSSLESIAREIAVAVNIYLPGSMAESAALNDWLTAHPESLAGKTIHSVWIAGMNGFDHAALDPAAKGVAYFTSPALADGLRTGRTKLLSLSFAQIFRALEHAALDLAFLHVSPPDANGWCSFGSCSDFGPAAFTGAKRRVGLVNRRMPTTFGSARVKAGDLDLLVDTEGPVHTLPASPPNEAMRAIGAHVAALVRDGDVLQLGIGSMQVAVLQALAGHRGLRLHSGMISDAVMDLEEAGALAGGEDAIRTGIVAGDAGLVRWIDRNPKLWMAPVSETHEPAVLARLENFVAINSALEVDLLGQVNAESRAGRIISSSGGLTDFIRMAGFVPGGRPVVALGATAGGGKISRIVPALAPGTPVGITKADPLIVVTEYGTANLRGLDFDARAERLIAVAAPAHREALATAWRDLRRQLFG